MDAADHGETRALATYEDVLRAAARIEGVAQRTPVLTSRTANRLAGASFSFKAENLQRTGAFKVSRCL